MEYDLDKSEALTIWSCYCQKLAVILSVGIDICSISRINKIIDWYSDKTLSYLFTDQEYQMAVLSDCPAHILACCFALKEAVSKALGIGMAQIKWTDIERVCHQSVITVNLRGQAKKRMRAMSINDFEVVESFIDDMFVCVAVIAI